MEPVSNEVTSSVTNALQGQGVTFLSNASNKYTQKERLLTTAFRYLQEILLQLSDHTMSTYLSNGHVKNSTISPTDFTRTNTIFRPPKLILMGNLVTPTQAENGQMQLPVQGHTQTSVKLYVDILHINGLSFLHTKSKPINYIQSLQGCKMQHVISKFRFVIDKYVTTGFTISDVFTDNKFDSDKYRLLFLSVNLHICAQGEYLPIIWRSIWTVKERVRPTLQGMPHTSLLRLMIIKCTFNNFPAPSQPL